MKTITIELTDAEAILLDASASVNAMPGLTPTGKTFEEEVKDYTQRRLREARELAKRKITEPLTDEQLATAVEG